MLDWATLQVHRLLAAGAVLRFACDELERLGSFASAFVVEEKRVTHICTSASARIQQEYHDRFGREEIVFALTRETFDDAWTRLESGTALIQPDLVPRALTLLPAEARPVAEWMYWRSGEGALALLPLRAEGALVGLLTVLGGRLRESDLPAVLKFGEHVSVAWANARQFEKLTYLANRGKLCPTE